MKTNSPLKTFCFSRLAPLAVAITTTLIAQPAFAGALHLISLTENSPISLSATFDGSAVGITVLNTGTDQWTVTFPTSVQIGVFDIGAWREPEDPLLLNKAFRGTSANILGVVSDNSVFPEATVVNDGVSVLIGTDSADNVPIVAVFHDVAASNEVPDTGFTLGLFFLSLIALLGASRLPCLGLVR
jgi:hypothetical protein